MIRKGLYDHRHIIIAIIAVFIVGIGLGVFGSKFGFKENSVSTKLIAVDDEGNGVTADLTATVRKGSGLVLVNINNLVADLDTQTSARNAAEVAAKISGSELSKFDFIFDIKTAASKISGGSAGTPMTLAAIAALQNKSLRDDVAVTGIIDSEGRINPVGSIIEKAAAAKNAGMKLVLVPVGSKGNGLEHVRTKECAKYKDYDYCEISYKEVAIKLDNLEIEMKEVADIKEALQYALR